jgi:hypothetical protein
MPNSGLAFFRQRHNVPTMLTLLFVLTSALTPAAGQAVEKQVVVSITAPDIDGGILSEITWDNGALLLQGVVANPDGSLSARYVVVPAKQTTLLKLKEQTQPSIEYWNRKSKRSSPTGLGEIVVGSDSKMPMYCISDLQTRMSDAYDMGGMQKRTTVRLGRLLMHERQDGRDPYDGEIWSWSPAELNRIAYVDGKGDLWIASAEGRDARRLLKGDITLPAWSDDGRAIAVAELKDGGRRWEISIVTLPEALRTAR